MRDGSYRVVASTIPKEANEGHAHNAVEPRIQMLLLLFLHTLESIYKPKD
jgi:hypothetical protein